MNALRRFLANAAFPWFPLLGIAVVYALAIHAYYVGFFNDDAFYIIGARSLLQGRYVELNQPGFPPLLHHMPGYAVFLAPVALFHPLTFLPYQLLSVVMTLSGLAVLWRLLEGECLPPARWAIWILSALNPLTVSLSGTVMSDVPFLLVSLLFFYVLKTGWPLERPWQAAIAAALAVLLFYVRPAGVLAGLALAAALALDRRWTTLRIVVGVSALLVVPYFLRNWLLRGYAHPLLGVWSHGHFGQALLHNVQFYAREILVRTFFRWPGGPWQNAIYTLTVCGTFFLMLRGAFEWPWTQWRRVLAIYVCGYLLLHLMWGAQASRYFYPLLPFLLWTLFLGVQALTKVRSKTVWLCGTMVFLSLALSLKPLVTIVQASLYKPNPLNTPPARTYAWIRSQTQPQDIFMAENDGRFYIHTDRQCVIPPDVNSTQGLDGWMAERGIRYVFIEPNDFSFGGGTVYRPIPALVLARWLAEQRWAKRVFEDHGERTQIFEISAPQNFSRPKTQSAFSNR